MGGEIGIASQTGARVKSCSSPSTAIAYIADYTKLAERVVTLEGRIAALDFTVAEVSLVLSPMARGQAEFILGGAPANLGSAIASWSGSAAFIPAYWIIPIPAPSAVMETQLKATRIGGLISAIGPLAPDPSLETRFQRSSG